ncbi:permease family protein [Streptomyces puniciscabiei]|uniref:Permease family protein n=1 Tax=Streptomyces puniciscabiei TaxID=164348 RepID=A0A542U9A2_9ACTN|nr:permease family protein [Streptomyces puniciscabiei]
MAQPAKGPAHAPCSTPPAHTGNAVTSDAVTSVHPVDEKLHPVRLVPAALRHIAAMYAGVVTPPLIIGQACGLDLAARTRLIAASLIVAGVATIPQTIGVKDLVGNRLPLVDAASGSSAGALVAVLLNLFFHHLGTRSRQPAPALKSS